MFNTLLLAGCDILWAVTYVLIIRRSILDRSYGMPMVAACANISWEFIFSYLYPPNTPLLIAHLTVFFLDVIIVAFILINGPKEFANLPKRVFYTAFGFALVTSFWIVLFISVQLNDLGTYVGTTKYVGIYAAFGQNLMMSILFIVMLYTRGSLRGQSMGIAVCKLLGTFMASLDVYLYAPPFHGSVLLLFLYIAILVYDLIYVGLVRWYMKREGIRKLARLF